MILSPKLWVLPTAKWHTGREGCLRLGSSSPHAASFSYVKKTQHLWNTAVTHAKRDLKINIWCLFYQNRCENTFWRSKNNGLSIGNVGVITCVPSAFLLPESSNYCSPANAFVAKVHEQRDPAYLLLIYRLKLCLEETTYQDAFKLLQSWFNRCWNRWESCHWS